MQEWQNKLTKIEFSDAYKLVKKARKIEKRKYCMVFTLEVDSDIHLSHTQRQTLGDLLQEVATRHEEKVCPSSEPTKAWYDYLVYRKDDLPKFKVVLQKSKPSHLSAKIPEDVLNDLAWAVENFYFQAKLRQQLPPFSGLEMQILRQFAECFRTSLNPEDSFEDIYAKMPIRGRGFYVRVRKGARYHTLYFGGSTKADGVIIQDGKRGQTQRGITYGVITLVEQRFERAATGAISQHIKELGEQELETLWEELRVKAPAMTNAILAYGLDDFRALVDKAREFYRDERQ